MDVAINSHVTALDVAPQHAWFKSSYSSDQGGSCIEIADVAPSVGIRDSKVPTGPALVVPIVAWSSFIGMVCSADL